MVWEVGIQGGTGTEQATQEVKGCLMGNVAWTFPGQEGLFLARTGPCFLWEQTCEGVGLSWKSQQPEETDPFCGSCPL